MPKCAVRLYTKYQTLQARKKSKSSGRRYWLLLLVALIALGWLWWHSQHPAPKPTPVPPVATPRTNQQPITPAPVQVRTSAPPFLPPTNVAIRPVLPPTNAVTQPRPLPPTNVVVAPPLKLAVTSAPPVTNVVGFAARPVQNLFEAQLALARLGISSGSIDGVAGYQTRAAMRAFQQRYGIPPTGELDELTKPKLLLTTPPYTNYIVTNADLGRLRQISPTWLGKSQQDRLDHETILELVAELGHAHPGFIKQLNPTVNWTNVTVGTVIKLPNAEYPAPRGRAAYVRIHLSAKTLQAYDANGQLMAHFPCSIAKRVEKRPVGELHVEVVAENPNYRFSAEVFPESAEAKSLGRPIMIPPGPNNPVGLAWIGLNRAGYGIHGTPVPEAVGRTESHGCFRLANWNATYLLKMVWVGMPVRVEP